MRCPYCKEINRDKVIDSRLTEQGLAVRRRRVCLACGRRYTTKERVETESRITVVKKDGSRVPFDRTKILAGLQRACYKRPVPHEKLEEIANAVEEELLPGFEREIPSHRIGEFVAARLRAVDQVAYVRFASVYRDFQEVGDFIEEAQEVLERSAVEDEKQPRLF